MRGRKPKAVEARIAEGNPGKRPLPEPISFSGVEGLMEPPAHLPPDAKEFWRRTIPVLDKAGMLDGVDAAALEMAATAYARFRGASRVIAVEGMLTRGSRNQPMEHPAMASERKEMATFLRFAEQYGLTPVARTRMGLAEIERRTLSEEMKERFGKPEYTDADAEEEPVDAEVVDGEDDLAAAA